MAASGSTPHLSVPRTKRKRYVNEAEIVRQSTKAPLVGSCGHGGGVAGELSQRVVEYRISTYRLAGERVGMRRLEEGGDSIRAEVRADRDARGTGLLKRGCRVGGRRGADVTCSTPHSGAICHVGLPSHTPRLLSRMTGILAGTAEITCRRQAHAELATHVQIQMARRRDQGGGWVLFLPHGDSGLPRDRTPQRMPRWA